MGLSFRRITSSGSFIPEIDGLRFIAISSVVLYHFWCFYTVKDLHTYTDSTDYSFLHQILKNGNFGVELFFVISGMILGIPFAKYHINQTGKISLKKYFLRRLTRLEPPYIIVMAIFFSSVLIMGRSTIAEQASRFGTSLLYINNFLYPGQRVSGVAWSLEIEVQFYILAPLLAALFFAITDPAKRRMFLILGAVVSLGSNYFYHVKFVSLLDYLHYFLTGFLLADLYITGARLRKPTRWDSAIALVLFCTIWLYARGDFKESYQNFLWELLQLACVFLVYYFVLFHQVFRILTSRLITNIGGMCYSIYLLHYYVMSLFGNPLMNYKFSDYSFINTTIYTLILMIPISIVCGAFFLLVERPCMDKDWYKKIFRRNRDQQATAE